MHLLPIRLYDSWNAFEIIVLTFEILIYNIVIFFVSTDIQYVMVVKAKLLKNNLSQSFSVKVKTCNNLL